MPPKRAAGCLVRATFDGEERYLIVHPSGAYNRRAAWSIPKGELDPDEDPAVAALRETREETGLECRIVAELGEVTYQSKRKIVIGFLAEPCAPVSTPTLTPGDWEIDRAEFVRPDEARERLHADQRVFVDRALALAGRGS